MRNVGIVLSQKCMLQLRGIAEALRAYVMDSGAQPRSPTFRSELVLRSHRPTANTVSPLIRGATASAVSISKMPPALLDSEEVRKATRNSKGPFKSDSVSTLIRSVQQGRLAVCRGSRKRFFFIQNCLKTPLPRKLERSGRGPTLQ